MKVPVLICASLTLSLAFGCAKDDAKPVNVTRTASTPAPLPTPSIPRDGNYDGKGVVKKVDMDQGWVEIDHEPMPEVMPQAMTMIYNVSDKAMLKGLKAGDKIEFVLQYKHPMETVVGIKKVG